MKNLNRFTLTALASLLALPFFLSCSKEVVENLKPSVPEVETVTLKLSAPTKTTLLNDETVHWSAGDKILINGKLYNVTLDASDPGVALVADVPVANEYFALYDPFYANMDAGVTAIDKERYTSASGEYKLMIPTTTTYTQNSFSTFSSPSYAYGTGKTLIFRNIAGVVKIGLTGNGESLETVMLNRNTAAPLTGTIRVNEADMRSGAIDSWTPDNFNFELGRAYSNISMGSSSVVLGPEPTWFYFPVAPFTDPAGIHFTVVTKDGGVFMQKTTKEISVARSQVNELSAIEYHRFKDINLVPVETNSVSFKIEFQAEPLSSVRYTLTTKSVWDEFVKAGSTEDVVKTKILNLCGADKISFNETGKRSYQIIESRKQDKTKEALQPETEYVLVAQYDYAGGRGNCAAIFCKTSAVSGEAPTLTASVSKSEPNKIYTNIKTTNASIIKVRSLTYKEYVSLRAAGKGDGDIAAEGNPLGPKFVGYANSETGCNWYIDQLLPSTDYVILVLAISDGGLSSLEVLNGRTSAEPGISMTNESFTKTQIDW